MLALCVVTAGIGIAPAKVVRKVLYPVRYAEIIKSASQRYGVDEYLVCAVVKCESNWDPNVTSSAGAVGLMQMMPSTSAEVARLGLVDSRTYNPNDLTDPATNIEYGTAYLAYARAGFEAVTCFACFLGEDYEARWGAPPLDGFLAALRAARRP